MDRASFHEQRSTLHEEDAEVHEPKDERRRRTCAPAEGREGQRGKRFTWRGGAVMMNLDDGAR